MALRSRLRTILSKIESPYGTDSGPDGTDALLVREITPTPMEADVVSRNLIRPYMGASDNLLANTRVRMGFQVELAGSGTAATAPRFGALLQACGFSATTLGTAVTGTSAAGGAGSITLEAGASATDNAYLGMLISIGGGTGNGQKGVITAYNGTSKVATVKASTSGFTAGNDSVYTIAANVQYRPVSSSFSSATVYFNNDGVLHKATGCRGTASLSFSVGGIPTIDFDMMGIYNTPTDTAAPATAYSNQATPAVFKADNSSAFQVLGYSGCLSSATLALNNEMVYRELVGCTKEVLLTDRAPGGEVVIEAPTMAQKNFFTEAATDSTGVLSLVHGTTAGNRFSLVAPKVDITNPNYSDQDGIQMLTVPYTAIPGSAGNDEIILTFC